LYFSPCTKEKKKKKKKKRKEKKRKRRGEKKEKKTKKKKRSHNLLQSSICQNVSGMNKPIKMLRSLFGVCPCLRVRLFVL